DPVQPVDHPSVVLGIPMVVRDAGVSYATELPVVAGSQQFGVERHERLVALAHRSPGSREVQLDGQPLVVLSTSPFGDSPAAEHAVLLGDQAELDQPAEM